MGFVSGSNFSLVLLKGLLGTLTCTHMKTDVFGVYLVLPFNAILSIFPFFSFLFLLRAMPVASGSSWASGRIWATAASRQHSHSRTHSKLHL